MFVVCLDGSLFGYYFYKGLGLGLKSWFFYLEVLLFVLLIESLKFFYLGVSMYLSEKMYEKGGGWCSLMVLCFVWVMIMLGFFIYFEDEVDF